MAILTRSAFALLLLWPELAAAAPPQDWGPTTAFSVTATPLNAVPTSLVGSASWTSGCMAASFARAFDVYAAVAGAATLQVQRYADVGCTSPVGAAAPATALVLTQSGGCPGTTYCGDVWRNDTMPFISFIVTLTDTSGSTNAITKVTLTLGAE